MATITNLGFALTSEWNGAGVRAAETDLSRFQAQLATLGDHPVLIDIQTNAAAVTAEIDRLEAQLASREVVITVVANTAEARTSLEGTAAATETLVEAFTTLDATLATTEAALSAATDVTDALAVAMDAATAATDMNTAAVDANTRALEALTTASATAAGATRSAAGASNTAAGASAGAAAATATHGDAMNKVGRDSAIIFAAGMYESIKSATDFQTAMTLLATSAGLPEANIKDLGDALISISNETGTSAKDLATASYQVLSSGKNWQETSHIMHDAAELAKVDNSDIVTTTKAVTTTLTDYALAADKSTSVSDALRAAVERSRTTLGDFTINIGKAEVVASNLGMSYTQVYAALATLTQHGMAASNATTLLASTMTHMAESTPKSTAELEKLGLSANDFHLALMKPNGLVEALGILQSAIYDKVGQNGLVYLQGELKASGGNVDTFAQKMTQLPPTMQTIVDAFAQAVGGTRNLAVVLGLTGKNFDEFSQNATYVADRANNAGDAIDGWALKQQTFGVQMERAKASIRNMFIEIGTGMLPAVTSMAAGIADAGMWMEKNKIVADALLIVLGFLTIAWVANKIAVAAATAATAAWEAACWLAKNAMAALNAVMDANPIALVILAIAAIVVGLDLFFTKTTEGQRIWADFIGFFHAGEDGVSGFKRAIDSVGETFKNLWNATEPVRKLIGDVFGPAMRGTVDELKKSFSDIADKFETSIKPAFEGLMKALGPLWDAAKPILEAIGGALLLVGRIVWEMFNNAIRPVFNFLADTLTNIIDLIKGFVEILTGIFRIIDGVFQVIWGAIQIVFGLIKGIFTGDWSMFGDGIKNLVKGLENIFGGFVDVLQGAWHVIGAVWDEIFSIFKHSIELVIGLLAGFVEGIIRFFSSLGVHMDVSHIIDNIVGFFERLPGDALKLLTKLGDGIADFFGGLWDAVAGPVGRFFSGIIDAVGNFIGKFVSYWVGVDVKIVEAIGGWIGGVLTAIANFFEPVTRRFVQFFTGIVQILAIIGQDLLHTWSDIWDHVKAVALAIWDWIKSQWETVINAVKMVWDAFSTAFMSVWTPFWNAIKDFVLGIWNDVKAAWNVFWANVKVAWDVFSTAMSDGWNLFWNAIKDFVLGLWNDIKAAWQSFWDGVKSIWDTISGIITEAWNTFWNAIHDAAVGIWDKITAGFNLFKDGIKNVFTTLIDDVKGIWTKLEDIFKTPINFVIRTWNDKVVSHFPGVTKVDELAAGGPVNGPGGPIDDAVPIWASNGEHMWTAAEVDAAGGHDAVMQLRSQVLNRNGVITDDNRFAGGGAVERLAQASDMASQKGDNRAYVYGGSGPDGFDCSGYMSAIYNVLTGAQNWWSRAFSTESDFGSLGFQSGLGAGFAVGVHNGGGGVNSHMAGTLDGVNVESGGPHNSTLYGGLAVGADHGQFEHQYYLPVKDGDFVSGGQGGGGGGFVRNLLSKLFETITNPFLSAVPDPFFGTSQPFGSFPKGAATKSRDGILDWIKGNEKDAIGMYSGGGALPEGEHLGIINDALKFTSTPPPNSVEAWQAGMNTLIGRESGWNPYAQNNTDSNATAGTPSKGLAQVIQPTFDAYHQAGTSNDIFDAVANVSASINYIKSRYGDISNVQQADASRPPMGYLTGTMNAKSGWSVVGENGPEAINLRGGETIYSFDDILGKIKDGVNGTSIEVNTKLVTELRALGDRLQGQSDTVKHAIEAAVERALANAGVHMPVSISGSNPQEIMDSLQSQLLPQLEMMLRQGVGQQ